MATNDTPRTLVEKLRDAAAGVPNTARGRLMAEAAEALEHSDLVIDELRQAAPPEPWVMVDPSSGPAVFYLGLDGTLYRYDENDLRPIPGMVDRAVARTLLRIASESLEEADRG